MFLLPPGTFRLPQNFLGVEKKIGCGYTGAITKELRQADKKKEKRVSMKKQKQRYSKGVIRENLKIYAMMLPTLILILIFCYVPMYGLIIAFQDYVPGASFLGPDVKWVGLKWFQKFISGHYFGRLVKNTLILSGLNLLFGFTAPILFALLLDQIRHHRFKKVIQTASYLPYFISTVVVAGIRRWQRRSW